MQRILDCLSDFCLENKLTVSLKKTEWLVTGFAKSTVRAEIDVPEEMVIRYRGAALTKVT